MTDRMRTADGRYIEQESLSGPDNSGGSTGFTISTDLGRVDEVDVSVESVTATDETYLVEATGNNDGTVDVTVYELQVDTTTSNSSEPVALSDVTDNTDLSDVTFVYTATRQ